MPLQFPAVQRRERTANLPKALPSPLRFLRLGPVLRRDIERSALAALAIGEIQVWPMSFPGIP
jgi:hypothetical protein